MIRRAPDLRQTFRVAIATGAAYAAYKALGLPQGVQITVKGSGAGETLVKSGPNAREPQNRVAIITIN